MKSIKEINDKISEISIKLKKANDDGDIMMAIALQHQYNSLKWVIDDFYAQ